MSDLSDRVDTLGQYLDIDGRRDRLAALQAKRLEPGFWDDPETAAGVEQEISAEKDWTDTFDALLARRDDLETLREMQAEAQTAGADDADLAARSPRRRPG